MGGFSPTVATTVSGMDDDVREALAKDMTIDLTTIGRKSGEPRRIEIWMIKVGDRIVITGTPEQVASYKTSWTGKYLAPVLNGEL